MKTDVAKKVKVRTEISDNAAQIIAKIQAQKTLKGERITKMDLVALIIEDYAHLALEKG